MNEPTRDDASVSLDAILELLASRRCRYALYELRREESLTIDELARRVAAREHDDPDSDQFESVRRRLHHDSLPKLEAHAIVERDGDEVTSGRYAPVAEPYVEWAKEWEADQ